MIRTRIFAAAIVATVALPHALAAQGAAGDSSRSVADGGIHVAGWMGRVDANEAAAGLTLNDARFHEENGAIIVTTGPATTYWNPANVATGNYTVRATFTEPQYMNLNNHPHPYGIVIGGNGLGSNSESLFYCAAYGDGRFIARGFGPAAFQMNGRGAANAAINRAPGPNQPVTQEIAVSVRGDTVECSINGTVVGSYPRAELVAEGRLTSTDGMYGLRFGHNTQVRVTGLTMTRP